jgi:hypothetical protein
VSDPGSYHIAAADIESLKKANTDLNKAITKLKSKAKSR